MSEMLGADVEELRALARDFSGKSQKLVQGQKVLDGAVNQLPRYWQGPDAQRFAAQWRGQHRGVVARTAADNKSNPSNIALRTCVGGWEAASGTGSDQTIQIPGVFNDEEVHALLTEKLLS